MQDPYNTRHRYQGCRFAELSMFKISCLNPALKFLIVVTSKGDN